MKAIACALAVPLLLLSIPATVSAQAVAADATEQRQQLAREIIANGFPEEARMDIFGGTVQRLVSQLNDAQPGLPQDPAVQEIALRYQQRAVSIGLATLEGHMDDLMEGLAISYSEIYSLDELQAFHAFIMSPQGHGFLAKSSKATGHPAFSAANQAFMNEYMAQLPDLLKEMREELTAAHLAKEAGDNQS